MTKAVAITGAAGGIGSACAERFANDGWQVMIADIDAEKAAETAKWLSQSGADVRSRKVDTGDKASVDAMITATVDAFGRLDALINNAAILHVADVLDLDEEDFDRTVRVNLKGYFLCAQSAARYMAEHGGGVIINMSSVQAVLSVPNILPYVVCKGGVNQMTKTLAIALADKNIRVNAIGPGTIMTDLARTLLADETAMRKVMSRTPMGRGGEPSEIAAIAAFLASDDSSYITGECIYADGGRLGLNYTVPVAE
ncbi:MAG: SDR family oxidoreductase [Rhodospirillales bacterium]